MASYVPAKVLVNLIDLGIPYSMNMISLSRDYYRRNPQVVEGVLRAYIEGVAALRHQKDKAVRVIVKYSRIVNDPKKVEEHYQSSVTYLESVPRVEPDGVSTILEFMGRKGVALESIGDNSIIDRLVREGFVDKLYGKQ